jgi:hypothetical protein
MRQLRELQIFAILVAGSKFEIVQTVEDNMKLISK